MEWDLKEMGRPWKKDPFPRRKGSLSQTHSLPKPFPPHSVQYKCRFDTAHWTERGGNFFFWVGIFSFYGWRTDTFSENVTIKKLFITFRCIMGLKNEVEKASPFGRGGGVADGEGGEDLGKGQTSWKKFTPSQTHPPQELSHHAPSIISADFSLHHGRSAVGISFLGGLFFVLWLTCFCFQRKCYH